MRKIDSIIVHCSGTNIWTTVPQIRDYHVNTLHWNDIGYHYLIDEYGREYVGRDYNEVGAHCKGYNDTSIGICLIGGRWNCDFTFEQYLTLLGLLKRLSHSFCISKDMIFNHYDFNKNKKCPQFDIQNLIKHEKGFYKKGSDNS